MSSFAGASRSKAAKDVLNGDVRVMSFWISCIAMRCAASAFCSPATASGARDLFAASDSRADVASTGACPGTVEALPNDLLRLPRYSSWRCAASTGETSPKRSVARGISAIVLSFRCLGFTCSGCHALLQTSQLERDIPLQVLGQLLPLLSRYT